MSNETESKVFACYRPPLYFHLLNSGLKPIKTGINRANGLPYAIFSECEALHLALVEWANNRPNK